MSKRDDRRGLGRHGENLAARHLAARGYEILERNWRCGAGELDLVARDGAEVAAHLAGLTPARAREIGQAARRRALAEHTYARRAAQCEDLLGVRAAEVSRR